MEVLRRMVGVHFQEKIQQKSIDQQLMLQDMLQKILLLLALADKCLVQVSYAIGVAKPTSIMVDSFGTAKLSDEELSKIVMENFDLRPKGIVNMLDLLRPIYRKTAAYGHFGRTEPEFSWEKIDKKDLT